MSSAEVHRTGQSARIDALDWSLLQPRAPLPVEFTALHGEFRDATDELVAAAEELRDYARGIHAVLLTERGLGPALKALARRSSVPVDLDVRLDAGLPLAAETGTYYIVSEGLTNTARHANASGVAVVVAANDGVLRVSIRDDGIGGAEFGAGSGLVGLRDRVAALAGHVAIESPPGSGTAIRVELPLAGDASLTPPT